MLFDDKHMKLLFDLKLPPQNTEEKSFITDNLETNSESLKVLTDLSDLSCTVPKFIKPFSISIKRCTRKYEEKTKTCMQNGNITKQYKKKRTKMKSVPNNTNNDIYVKPNSPALSIDSAIDLSADNIIDMCDLYNNNFTHQEDVTDKSSIHQLCDSRIRIENCLHKNTEDESSETIETLKKVTHPEDEAMSFKYTDWDVGQESDHLESTGDSLMLSHDCMKKQKVKHHNAEETGYFIPRPDSLPKIKSTVNHQLLYLNPYLIDEPIPILIQRQFSSRQMLQKVSRKRSISTDTFVESETNKNLVYIPRSNFIAEMRQAVNYELFDLSFYHTDKPLPIFVKHRLLKQVENPKHNCGNQEMKPKNLSKESFFETAFKPEVNITSPLQHKSCQPDSMGDIFNAKISVEMDHVMQEISSFEPCIVSNTSKEDMFTECLINLVSDGNKNSQYPNLKAAPTTPPSKVTTNSLSNPQNCVTANSDNFRNPFITSIPLKENIGIRTLNFIVNDDERIPEGLKKHLPCNEPKENETADAHTKCSTPIKIFNHQIRNKEIINDSISLRSSLHIREQCTKLEYKFNIALLQSISSGILKKVQKNCVVKSNKCDVKPSKTLFNTKRRSNSYQIKQKKILKAKEIVLKSKHILRQKRNRDYQLAMTWQTAWAPSVDTEHLFEGKNCVVFV